MVKAVIFDMDGVIIDSEPINYQTTNEVIKQYGAYLSHEQNKQFIGTSDIEYFSKLVNLLGIPEDPAKLFTSWQKTVFDVMKEGGIVPMPGVITVIQQLHQRKYKLAVASSGDRKRVHYILNELNIKQFFPAILTGDDVSHGKPAPDIYLKTMARLRVQPPECVVIEDSDHGVEAAKRAGIKVIGFRNPHSDGQLLKRADIILRSFTEWRDTLLS